jgi:hypothetical protein
MHSINSGKKLDLFDILIMINLSVTFCNLIYKIIYKIIFL